MSSPLRLALTASIALLGLVACGTEETVRQFGELEGIDVSHHQSQIDWMSVAADQIDFAYIKATEGEDHRDSQFCANWAGAHKFGLTRGAYHFFRPNSDARAQFDFFQSVVALQPGDLPPVIDVEVLDDASPAELVEGLRTWIYLAEIAYGVKPVIYTNLKFYYHHLAGHFDDYPLWIARYGETAPSLSTAAQLNFWQYGDRGRVDGVDGYVDLNVFVGERPAFDALLLEPPPTSTLAQNLVAEPGRF